MIYEFQVHTSRRGDRLINDLDKRLKWLKQKGFSLQIVKHLNELADREIISFILSGESCDEVFTEKDIKQIFCHQMAEALANHIVREWECELLWKEIQRNCKQIEKDEQRVIYDKASGILGNHAEEGGLNLLFAYGKKSNMTRRILEHIQDNDQLVIEGFINFCLQDFLKDLRFAVEIARDEVKNEKEYVDFIKLLRFFVEGQSPRINEVNVKLEREGLFCLWDDNGSKIEEKYLNYFIDDILLNKVSLDDVLISILITIAPRKIILHNLPSGKCEEAVELIKSVFNERICICYGCDRCYNTEKKPDNVK